MFPAPKLWLHVYVFTAEYIYFWKLQLTASVMRKGCQENRPGKTWKKSNEHRVYTTWTCLFVCVCVCVCARVRVRGITHWSQVGTSERWRGWKRCRWSGWTQLTLSWWTGRSGTQTRSLCCLQPCFTCFIKINMEAANPRSLCCDPTWTLPQWNAELM